MTRNAVVEKAAEIAGGQSALAKACGVSPQAVSQWIRGLRPVAHRHGRKIEDATKGEIGRRDLFPDSWQEYWPELGKQKRRSAKEPAHA